MTSTGSEVEACLLKPEAARQGRGGWEFVCYLDEGARNNLTRGEGTKALFIRCTICVIPAWHNDK